MADHAHRAVGLLDQGGEGLDPVARVEVADAALWMWPQMTPSQPRRAARERRCCSKSEMKLTADFTRPLTACEKEKYSLPRQRRQRL